MANSWSAFYIIYQQHLTYLIVSSLTPFFILSSDFPLPHRPLILYPVLVPLLFSISKHWQSQSQVLALLSILAAVAPQLTSSNVLALHTLITLDCFFLFRGELSLSSRLPNPTAFSTSPLGYLKGILNLIGPNALTAAPPPSSLFCKWHCYFPVAQHPWVHPWFLYFFHPWHQSRPAKLYLKKILRVWPHLIVSTNFLQPPPSLPWTTTVAS